MTAFRLPDGRVFAALPEASVTITYLAPRPSLDELWLQERSTIEITVADLAAIEAVDDTAQPDATVAAEEVPDEPEQPKVVVRKRSGR